MNKQNQAAYYRNKRVDDRELCLSVLLYWRMLLCCAIIGAAVLGGYRAVAKVKVDVTEEVAAAGATNIQAQPMSEEELNQAVEVYNQKLALQKENESRLNEKIASLEETVAWKEAEIANFKYMLSMDKEHVMTTSGEVFIKIESGADLVSILKEYNRCLESTDLSDVAKKYDLSVAEIRNLSTIESSSNYINLYCLSSEGDLDMAEDVVEALYHECEKVHDTIADQFGEHSLHSEEIRSTQEKDITRILAAENKTSELATMNTDLLAAKNELEAAKETVLTDPVLQQQELLAGVQSGEAVIQVQGEKINEYRRATKPEIIKMCIIGLIVGVAVGILLCLAVFIFGDKILSGKELEVATGIKCLGTISSEYFEKKKTKFDRFIIRLLRDVKDVNLEKELEWLAVGVKMAIMPEPFNGGKGKRLCLAGQPGSRTIEKIRESLSASCEGVEFMLVTDMMGVNPQMVADGECSGTIFVEQARKSTCRAVVKETEICEMLGLPIVGTVIYD